MARQTHVDGVAGIVEGVGTFVYEDDVGIAFDMGLDYAKSSPVVHRHRSLVGGQTLLEFYAFGLGFRLQGGNPCRIGAHFARLQGGEDCVERESEVSHHGGGDGHVHVDFLRSHVELDKLHGGIPLAASER